MIIKLFIYILLVFSIILGLVNGLYLNKRKENDIFVILVEFIKIILPIIAVISMFLPLDYNSFWFVVYVSIYYALESIYNLLGKIYLKDAFGNKFQPNILEQKTKKMISSFTIIYILSLHLLLNNTISCWFSNSIFVNIISIIGIVILIMLSILGVLLIIYDFISIISFSIFNNLINKTIKNIENFSYRKLYNKIRLIDKYFVYVYQPEIDTQFILKHISSKLKFEISDNESTLTLSKQDQEFVIEILTKFQNYYIK